jgi:hypothetical protein
MVTQKPNNIYLYQQLELFFRADYVASTKSTSVHGRSKTSINKALAVDAAEDALDALEAKWEKQYPIVI